VKLALTSKISTITSSYILCIVAAFLSVQTLVDGSSPDHVFHNVERISFILYIIPFFCAATNIAFSVITQSVEKDWLVVLSDGDSAWLSNTNSVLSQIDLVCNSLAPPVTGLLFYLLNDSVGLVSLVLLILNLIATYVLYTFMKHIYTICPNLEHRIAPVNVSTSTNSRTFRKSMTNFLKIDCAGVMIAYSFLFLTVLSFGPLMTVYLQWCGMSDYWIGISRGAASVSGFLGAFIFPRLKARYGLWTTALGAIWYQFFFVLIAAIVTIGSEGLYGLCAI
jgi:iron-regulated transporter 1